MVTELTKLTEREKELMEEFNELVDEYLCELWEKGLEVGHDGQLCHVDTPWAMGFEPAVAGRDESKKGE